MVEGLDWARGEYRSPRGRIASSWRREPGRLVVEVEVPVNATAELHLPAAAGATILESGRALGAVERRGPASRTDRRAVVVASARAAIRFEVTEGR